MLWGKILPSQAYALKWLIYRENISCLERKKGNHWKLIRYIAIFLSYV
jgi:hypothetical protein